METGSNHTSLFSGNSHLGYVKLLIDHYPDKILYILGKDEDIVQFVTYTDDTPSWQEISGLLIHVQIDPEKVEHVVYLSRSTNYSLIPSSFGEDTTMLTQLTLNTKNSKVIEKQLDELHALLVYTESQHFMDALISQFPWIATVHFTEALMRFSWSVSANHVLIELESESITILIQSDEGLQIMNSFPAIGAEEALYYASATMQDEHVPHDFPIYLTGDPVIIDEYLELFHEYFDEMITPNEDPRLSREQMIRIAYHCAS